VDYDWPMIFDDNLLLELILWPHIPPLQEAPSPKCVTHQPLMTLIHRIHPNRKQKGSSSPPPPDHPLTDPPAMTIMTELISLGPAPCDLHEAFVMTLRGQVFWG
jgi:hypothetical protein